VFLAKNIKTLEIIDCFLKTAKTLILKGFFDIQLVLWGPVFGGKKSKKQEFLKKSEKS